MPIDILNAISTGFGAALGSALANWLLVKRLERFEKKLFKKTSKNGGKYGKRK